ncbi:MAG: thioredoxin family protein [Roseobacter sp.]
MSKSRQKHKRKKQSPTPEPNRRDALKMVRNGALGAVVFGGTGLWALGSFRAYTAEHDLTRVGQGAPTIVQIHDPKCPTCTALQKQTRAAMKLFSECGLVYLVADIKTQEGGAFAARYGVPHVTLLLFDGQGERLRTLSGMHSTAQLESIFSAHKTASA